MKITASEPVTWFPDNFTPTEYRPGEYYEVPLHVAQGMLARQVAVAVGGEPGTPGEPGVKDPSPPPPPQRDPAQSPKPDENGDDDDEVAEAAGRRRRK